MESIGSIAGHLSGSQVGRHLAEVGRMRVQMTKRRLFVAMVLAGTGLIGAVASVIEAEALLAAILAGVFGAAMSTILVLLGEVRSDEALIAKLEGESTTKDPRSWPS